VIRRPHSLQADEKHLGSLRIYATTSAEEHKEFDRGYPRDEDLSTSFVLACYVPVLLPLSMVSADPRARYERWAVHIILSVLMYYLNS
jgi:hypothetical protein